MDGVPLRPWLPSAIMERLTSPRGVQTLLLTGVVGLLSFTIAFLYRAVSIRQRTIMLRKQGLVSICLQRLKTITSLHLLPVLRASSPHLRERPRRERHHG